MSFTQETPKITKKRRKEILRAARNLINDDGRHWIKGRLSRRNKDGEKCYCTIGAIHAVTTDPDEREQAVHDLLELGIGEVVRECGYFSRAYYKGRGQVESWNDASKRTWEDVNAAFRAAVRSI